MKHLFACGLLLGLAPATRAQTLAFEATTLPGQAGVAQNVVVADFNADGRLDMATGNRTGIEVLLSTGAGTFQVATYPLDAFASCLRAADLNGDGKPELLASSSAGGNMRLLVNAGSGTFPKVVTLNVRNDPQAWEFIVADFNRDGLPDVVGPAGGSLGAGLGPRVGLYMSSPSTATTGEFIGPFPFSNQTGSDTTLAYDVNADGFPDLITTELCFPYRRPCAEGDHRNLYLNTPTGLVRTQSLPDSRGSSALAELNGDALPDFIETVSNGYRISYQAPDGTFVTSQAVPLSGDVSRSVSRLRIADFDQDGRQDLAGLSIDNITPQHSVVLLQRNLGNGQFEAAPLVLPIGSSNARALEVADFNQDGRPDLAVIDGGHVKVFWNGKAPALHAATLAQVQLYPNPAQGQLRLDAVGAAFPLQLTLRNTLGQAVATHTLGTSEDRVDVARLTAGWYTAHLRDAQGRSKSVPVQLQ